jgi:ribosome biogenesis GTPase
MAEEREGTVIRVEGSACLVQVDGAGAPARAASRCSIRRSLRAPPGEAGPDGTVRLAAGDRVRLGDGDVVTELLPRKTRLARRAAGEKAARGQVVAANVDQLAIILAAREPAWRPGLIDRLLVAAENGGLEPFIVANKMDLVEDAEARAAIERDLAGYRGLGYRAIAASVVRGEGIEAIREALRGRTTVVAGPSGAGKSTLLNAIEPGLRLRTGEVSRATRKGRHTTTRAALIPLSVGGFVVDTPGVREFGFYDVTREDLPWLFREFSPLRERCRFPNCAHTVEPDCAVREAALSGVISPRRYASYLRIRESLPASSSKPVRRPGGAPPRAPADGPEGV